jgi:hypothetical protein
LFLQHLTFLPFFKTPGEKPGGSRAALVLGVAVEPPGFSPGVLKKGRKVRCCKNNETELLF